MCHYISNVWKHLYLRSESSSTVKSYYWVPEFESTEVELHSFRENVYANVVNVFVSSAVLQIIESPGELWRNMCIQTQQQSQVEPRYDFSFLNFCLLVNPLLLNSTYTLEFLKTVVAQWKAGKWCMQVYLIWWKRSRQFKSSTNVTCVRLTENILCQSKVATFSGLSCCKISEIVLTSGRWCSALESVVSWRVQTGVLGTMYRITDDRALHWLLHFRL